MSDIRITIGGRLDRSLEESFARVTTLARKANESANRELTRRGSPAQNAELVAARQIHAEQSRLNRDIMRQQIAAQKQVDAQARTLARQRAREELAAIREARRQEREAIRERERDERRIQSATIALQRQRSAAMMRQYSGRERDLDRLATRTSHRATRFLFPRPEGAIGYASRTANELMRGMGIDVSFAGGVARAKERETAGMGLAQQERIATGKTKGGAYWSGVSQDVGAALSYDPAKVTELMRAFTGKTGDFAEAPGIAKELGAMSVAAGADLGEMGDAAGYVYNQLKGMPDAAKLTLDVMRGIVGQTAVGAVEMKDYASQMGRVAANAKQFEGNAADNILMLSALTQLSIAEGGATSGADAARSTAAFANTTNKGQRINAFKRHGVNLFNKEGTQKRSIEDILHDSMIASKGNLQAFSEMWADTLGQKPLKGLLNAYNSKGGGEAGWKAAKEKIAPYLKAQMTEDAQRKNLEDYQATAAAKAQRFQNQLDRITESLASRLIPAMEQLAPTALSIAKSFGNFVAWASENPGKVIAAAISLSIGRAFTESLFRSVIDSVIKRGVGGPGGGGGVMGGPMGGKLAAAGTGLAVGAAVYAGIDYAGKSQYNEGVEKTGAISKGLVGVHGAGLGQAILEAEQQLKKYQNDKGLVGGAFSGMMNMFGAGDEADVKGLEDLIARKRAEFEDFRSTGKLSPEAQRDLAAQRDAQGQAQKEADALAIGRATGDALKGQTLNVRVTNASDIGGGDGGPRVDPSGRSGREGY